MSSDAIIGMDPSEAELNAMSGLADVAAWAGTSGPVDNLLRERLGDPAKIRDIAFVDRATWDRVTAGLKITVTPASDTNPAVERDLTPVESSRVEIYRRICLLRLGITPDFPGSVGLPVARVNPIGMHPTATAGGTSSPHGASPTRKLKLSSVIDPTLDAEIVQVPKSELDKMYGDYKVKFGAHPAPDTDPTADQISGLKQLVSTGSLPYVDLSVWTPHGLRHLRKQVFTSHILNAATGEWTKKELPGPSDVDSWMRAFKTFRIAMVLMGAADSEHLEAYSDYIKDLSQQFGSEAWGIIYKADCRMRSEYMERIRRALEENPAHGYSPASPWSAVFASAIREAEYWRKEVTTPATLLLARAKQSSRADDSDSEPRARTQPGKKKKRKAGARDDNSVFDSSKGFYTKNRKGIEICEKFNKQSCGNGKAQSKCANNRSHQCNLCLGPHMATQCKGPKGKN